MGPHPSMKDQSCRPTSSRSTPRREGEAQTGHQEAELDKEEAKTVLCPYEDQRENLVLCPYEDQREDLWGEDTNARPM